MALTAKTPDAHIIPQRRMRNQSCTGLCITNVPVVVWMLVFGITCHIFSRGDVSVFCSQSRLDFGMLLTQPRVCTECVSIPHCNNHLFNVSPCSCSIPHLGRRNVHQKKKHKKK